MQKRSCINLTKQEYRKAIDDVIYLCGCAVNGVLPEKKRTDEMNLEQLFKASQNHTLSAIAAYALGFAGIKDHAFEQAKAKAIRKEAVMEIDKEQLFQQMEEKGIWYMPLKGTVIKGLYPAVGMRQMADFDILFDKNYQTEVRDIMTGLGFSCEHFGKGSHDVYFKKPVSNFEMHTELFGEVHKGELFRYYRNINDRLVKDPENGYGYHLSANDFYIYIMAHEYKHFSNGGTGIRSLLDTYVIWQKLGKELDAAYIKAECTKLGISEFEQKNKQLSLHLFGDEALTDDDREMLEYIIFSGTYGTVQNSIENSVKKYGGGKKGKRNYILKNLFLPMREIKAYYPFFYRHKILLPGLFFYRIGKAVTVKRKQTFSKLKQLRKLRNK